MSELAANTGSSSVFFEHNGEKYHLGQVSLADLGALESWAEGIAIDRVKYHLDGLSEEHARYLLDKAYDEGRAKPVNCAACNAKGFIVIEHEDKEDEKTDCARCQGRGYYVDALTFDSDVVQGLLNGIRGMNFLFYLSLKKNYPSMTQEKAGGMVTLENRAEVARALEKIMTLHDRGAGGSDPQSAGVVPMSQ